MGSISTLIYTSELILCFTICVLSATRHNIHMYPCFLFAAIHNLKSSPTFSVRPRSSVGRVTVDLIRRSWVRFPPRSKYFLFTSCGSLIPFTRAKAPAKRSQHVNPTYRNIVGRNMLCSFGHHVAMCCDMLGVVGSSLKMVKFGPTTPNTSQHVATGWPNARNMLRPTMLRYVELACCDRLAGA